MAGDHGAGAPTQGIHIWPGLILAFLLALAAWLVAPLVARFAPLPALLIALLMGIALQPVLSPRFAPGLRFCVSRILRVAVALLGLKVSLSEIAALGFSTAFTVIIAMVLTIAAGFALARLTGLSRSFGALAGCATAICGASAALATSSVLPRSPFKDADTVFVIVAVNLLSTIAMLAYPPLAQVLGFDDLRTGVLLGGSIHDVAQVVGAGYAVSETAGATAVIVKLFRVLLLLPAILIIGRLFVGGGEGAKVPVPVFAFAFLVLCVINSAMVFAPALQPVYGPVKMVLGEVSAWGLLVAIAALGLNTSFESIAQLGWRHVLVISGTTLVILACVLGGLVLEAHFGFSFKI